MEREVDEKWKMHKRIRSFQNKFRLDKEDADKYQDRSNQRLQEIVFLKDELVEKNKEVAKKD